MIPISDLVDNYKREVTSDLLALRNIGKRISGKKDIHIEFNNYNDAAFTDGENICLPKFCRKKIKAAQGFVAHESGHIGYGSFELGFLELINKLTSKYKLPGFFVRQLINILEDVRINELNKIEFPGFHKNLREYTLKMLPKIKAKINYFENIFLYIDLFMENYPEYQKKPDFPRFPMNEKDWETICTVKEFLLNTLTPNASIIAADQLCKLLIKYFKFEDENTKNSLAMRSSSSEKLFEREVYLGRKKGSGNGNVIFLPSQFEQFVDKKIEGKQTTLSKTSNKMIGKIDKIDLSAEDFKQLTEKIKGLNEDNDQYKQQKIGKSIDGTLSEAYKRTRNSFRELKERLEKVNSENLDVSKKQAEESKITELLKENFKTQIEEQKRKISKEKKQISKLKEILDDFEDLSRETNKNAKNTKKKDLSRKIKSYREKTTNEEGGLDDLFEFIKKSGKDFSDDKSKQSKIANSLKKVYERKNNKVKEREKVLNEDIDQLQEIIETLDQKTGSLEVIKKIKAYEDWIKRKREGEKNDFMVELEGNEGKRKKKKQIVIDLITDINQAKDELNDRLIRIGRGVLCLSGDPSKDPRKVIETRIENDKMRPIKLSYSQINIEQRAFINKMKLIFKNLKKSSGFDNYQKRGRLNKNFIKAVTSNYSFKKCFTRRINHKNLKILLLVDISGSMRGRKLECAKISMIILTEALKDLADIRIVLFTGNYNAKNILVKDFGEPLIPKNVDKVGCHKNINSNLDGLSMEHEAFKLHGDEIIIIISDGQPAGYRGYGLREAMDQIHKVRRRFKVFAFSIDAKGEYLDKLYGKNNWILTKSAKKTDLIDNIMKFARLVVNEFY